MTGQPMNLAAYKQAESGVFLSGARDGSTRRAGWSNEIENWKILNWNSDIALEPVYRSVTAWTIGIFAVALSRRSRVIRWAWSPSETRAMATDVMRMKRHFF